MLFLCFKISTLKHMQIPPAKAAANITTNRKAEQHLSHHTFPPHTQRGSSPRFDGLVIESWPTEALAKTTRNCGWFSVILTCIAPGKPTDIWKQGHSLLLHSHTSTVTIQNHYIEFRASGEWWSFNYQWTSFLSISTLDCVFAWTGHYLLMVVIISHPPHTQPHTHTHTYLAPGFLLWELCWSCDHPKPPYSSNRLQSQSSFDLKILAANKFLSLSPTVICSNSFLIRVSKEKHLYCSSFFSFFCMCFPPECWSLAYRDGIDVSLSVCIWVETCLGDGKLSVGLDLRKASMTRRKRSCLSPDGLREKSLAYTFLILRYYV